MSANLSRHRSERRCAPAVPLTGILRDQFSGKRRGTKHARAILAERFKLNCRRRIDRRQGYIDFTSDARRIKCKAHGAVKLMDEALLNQTRSETLARRGRNRWAPSLLPSKAELIFCLVNLPRDLYATARCRQRTVFGSVGTQLVDRHRKRDRGRSGNFNVRTLDNKPARCFAIKRFNGLIQDFAKLGRFPVGLQQQIMRPTERDEPMVYGLLSGSTVSAERSDWDVIAMTVARIFLMR